MEEVVIIGSGPAGLSAAHYLSLKGYKITVFESESQVGGMLYCAIPPYRLPKETIKKEIESLLDENITIKCNNTLGTDISIEGLFEEGFQAILLAIGAHKSKPLGLKKTDFDGTASALCSLEGGCFLRYRSGLNKPAKKSFSSRSSAFLKMALRKSFGMILKIFGRTVA